jgi:hypothetical protein
MNTQAYQRKTEEFLVTEEKSFIRSATVVTCEEIEAFGTLKRVF